jgi:hypothetical protein
MINRCHSQYAKEPHKKCYQSRGIGLCDSWRASFKSFYDWAVTNGYKKGLEIDRIDNNQGYSPDNCRWVSRTENMNNIRNNIIVKSSFGNLPLCVTLRKMGIDKKHWNTIRVRVLRGKHFHESVRSFLNDEKFNHEQ